MFREASKDWHRYLGLEEVEILDYAATASASYSGTRVADSIDDHEILDSNDPVVWPSYFPSSKTRNFALDNDNIKCIITEISKNVSKRVLRMNGYKFQSAEINPWMSLYNWMANIL